MDDYSPLTARDVVALAAIVRWAQDGAHVARLGEDGRMSEGTARHIVKSPDDYGFLSAGEDIRAGYLRVTLTSGFDVAWPVGEMVTDYAAGVFASI